MMIMENLSVELFVAMVIAGVTVGVLFAHLIMGLLKVSFEMGQIMANTLLTFIKNNIGKKRSKRPYVGGDLNG